MPDNLADRIRKMAEMIEPEYISASLKLPLEVVKGIINGEIPDEILSHYDPAKPPEVRIVEKKHYVRNKVIAVYGPGGTGATSVAGMLALMIANHGRTVCAVDLSEYSALGYYLGIDCWREKAVKYTNILWMTGKHENLEITTEQENLKVIPGAATAKKHQEADWASIQKQLEEISRQYETVILDLPHNFELSRPVIDRADCLILVMKGDEPGINALWQMKPLLEAYLGKTYVVFNKAREITLPAEIKEILEYTAGKAYLQYDPKLKFDAFESLKSEFARSVKRSLLPLLGYEEKEEPKKLLGIFKIS